MSVDTGVGVSSNVGAVSEQCRSSVGQCRGFLTVDLLVQCRACQSVKVSECRAVSECRSVGVSECRSVEALRASLADPTSLTQSDLLANVPLAHFCCDEGKVANVPPDLL